MLHSGQNRLLLDLIIDHPGLLTDALRQTIRTNPEAGRILKDSLHSFHDADFRKIKWRQINGLLRRSNCCLFRWRGNFLSNYILCTDHLVKGHGQEALIHIE